MRPRRDDAAEQRLAEALRAEAERQTPAHSALLHERIMSQVRREALPAARGRGAVLRLVWMALPAAAALFVAAWIWHRAGPPGPRPTHEPAPMAYKGLTPPPLPSPEAVLGPGALAAREELQRMLVDDQLACLDQDARRLARFMKESVDVVPSRR